MVVTLVALVFSACGYQGNLTSNDPPTITISSFTGHDSLGEADDFGAVAYQQRIYWSAHSVSGVVVGFAYRVMDTSGQPISTPGNDFIDEYGDVASRDSKALRQLGAGWVLHYKSGASTDYPLWDDRAARTVFTEEVFATINFPVRDEHGNTEFDPETGLATPTANSFEVVAIDNRGNISQPAKKYFFNTTRSPSVNVTSSRGALMNQPQAAPQRTGMGIRLLFSMPEQRVGVVPTRPWYYEYKLLQADIALLTADTTATDFSVHDFILADQPYPEPDRWYNTRGTDRISEVTLTRLGENNTPPLQTNYENNVPTSVTVLFVRVVDLAGVTSDPIWVNILINDRYRPRAVLYTRHIYALGDHHFVETQDNTNADIAPIINSPTGVRFATFLSATPVIENGTIVDYRWEVVGNEQTRFWFRWGYHGEFTGNNPNLRSTNIVRDDATSANYLSEISYYHLQLNDARFNFLPLINTPFQNRPDWLRIPANHEIAQRISINGLAPGDHVLRLQVEDLQGELSEVVELAFTINRPLTNAERTGGVLYIDNSQQTNLAIRDFYQRIVPAGMNFTFVNRPAIEEVISSPAFNSYNIRNANHLFPISMLQNYRYVIYGSDTYGATIDKLPEDFNGIRQYMLSGGNVILVGNQRLDATHRLFGSNIFLSEYFGFPFSNAALDPLTTAALNDYYYFIGATAGPGMTTAGFPTSILPELENSRDPSIGGTIRTRAGLPSVTYFDNAAMANFNTAAQNLFALGVINRRIINNITPIYLFNCKPPDDDDRWAPDVNPTDPKRDRNTYQDKVVAFSSKSSIEANVERGTGYTFGFPLYHMKEDHARDVLAAIMAH
jgi:hypothetical protein